MNFQISDKDKLAVIGAGAWGTAIANLLAKKGFKINLWVYEADLCEIINETGENKRYFQGVKLSDNITAISDLQKTVENTKVIVSVVPSQFVRGIFKSMSGYILDETVIVSASKGIENKTLITISELFKEELKHLPEENYAVISGPSFAKEIAEEKPAAVVVASKSKETAESLQKLFSTNYFRVFVSGDVKGVEVGGALKNVIAIAAGISDGLGNGYNSRAAIVTRGLAEMMKIGKAMGAEPKTLAGLSGMGDLILTCTGELSRNRTLGLRIGKGEKMEAIQKSAITVAEGVTTVKSAYNILQKFDLKAAIIKETYSILYENKNPHQAMLDLMKLHTHEEF